MRIAHVLWCLGMGGMENIIADIARIQSGTDRVAVFVINDYVDESILKRIGDSCEVFLIGRKPSSRSLLPLLRLNLRMWSFRPDIIHVHANNAVRLIFAPLARKVRTVHEINDDPSDYRYFDRLFAISRSVRDKIASQGFDSELVFNGIDVDSIKKRDNVSAGEVFHMVQVGRLVPEKGQDIVLKALKSVKDSGHASFDMRFIGGGNLQQQLEAETSELGLEDNVIFDGSRPQSYVYSHLADYNLFVLASRTEGFGLVVAEAMAACVPVLVCDIEGPMEVIEGGSFGSHFVSEDAEDLAEKIISAMENPPSRKVLSDAREHVKTHYDISVTASRYLTEYKKLISKS